MEATVAIPGAMRREHPNGYPACPGYTAAIVGAINVLLVMLVRPWQSIDELQRQRCRESGPGGAEMPGSAR